MQIDTCFSIYLPCSNSLVFTISTFSYNCWTVHHLSSCFSSCWPSFLLFCQATLGKTFLSVSAHQRARLRGPCQTHVAKSWLWMAPSWPQFTARSFIVIHEHTIPSNLKLDWTSEPIYVGLLDVWFDYCGELPAVFALKTWPLTTQHDTHMLEPMHTPPHAHTHAQRERELPILYITHFSALL